MMSKVKSLIGSGLALVGTAAVALAEEPDITDTITSGVSTAEGIFTTVIGVTVTIFVARLALKWARRGS